MKRDRSVLLSIAHQFSYSIETLEDGILFDISGLERLIGKPEKIAQKILAELKNANIPGSVAVAGTVEAATLLARQQSDVECSLHLPDTFSQLPLDGLDIEEDTLNVFNDLGLCRVEDLLAIPQAELIDRYGCEFENVVRAIRQKGDRLLKPNLKESSVAWNYELDHNVEDFEQLIFILNHGLDTLFRRVAFYGLSTEHLNISFRLSNKTKRRYEIKTSFPTLERSFWLKLINLRVSLDPPDSGIVSLDVVSYFTQPRPSQRGLYAVSRPEPENLLLTVNKLKKLVGEENVGTPVLLDQRLARPFTLDADALPLDRYLQKPARQQRTDLAHLDGTSVVNGNSTPNAIVAFNYFHPPLSAEVLVREGRLVFVRTRSFSGRVLEYSGVWRANSKWWERPWRSHEWDIEIENGGIYRLCRLDREWLVVGEYD
jgi:protein ImuB